MTVASIKLLVKEVLAHAGIELRWLRHVNSEETVLAKLFSTTKPVGVLDVGANIGQYASLVRKLGYRGAIISFEAIPAVHAALVQAARQDSTWKIAPCAALGRAQGKAEMNISKNSVSSSLLPMHATHLDAAPDSVYVQTQTVRIERLDELAMSLLPASGDVLLKIDTQGYEKPVLEGATALLPRVAAIQVELSLVPLYDGAASFTEMIGFIQELGYELFSIVPGFRDVQSGRLLQVDGFFVRNG